jgi:maleate cis-trans isomerase
MSGIVKKSQVDVFADAPGVNVWRTRRQLKGNAVVDLVSLPRLGLVVPPENPTAEPELNRLLGERTNVFAARFPVVAGLGLRQALEAWNASLPATLAQFGGMRLDAAVVACSASHYLLSPRGDREFCERLSARAGYPVISTPQAILAACQALGVDRLTLVSPYEPWLTRTSRAYWEEAGLHVSAVVPVPAGDGYDPYRVTTAAILAGIRRQELPDDATLLFTGTGMATLAVLDALAATTDRPLLSSNLTAAWWAQRILARPAAHPLLARLRQPRPS